MIDQEMQVIHTKVSILLDREQISLLHRDCVLEYADEV